MSERRRIGIGCVRVSDADQERSIDGQKEDIRAAARNDGTGLLEDLWCEDEGITGGRLERPGLRKLLMLCETRSDITDVYFWRRNRLARPSNPLDAIIIERQIEKLGKHVHFVQGFPKTGNRTLDAIGGIVEYAEAGEYLFNISSDTIRELVPLTKAGFDAGRPTPYGFDRLVVDSKGKHLYTVRNLGVGVRHKMFPDGRVEVYENEERPAKDKSARSTLVLGDPARVAVVRRIFEASACEEKGMRTIAQELNAEGIPSPRGGLWSISVIRSISVNEVYYGKNVWNKRSYSELHRIVNGKAVRIETPDGKKVRRNDPEDWIEADLEHGFPPIVSKKLFDLAQTKRLQRNKPFTRGKAVSTPCCLTGLARCGCGHNLQSRGLPGGKKRGYGKYYCYICGGRQMKGQTVCQPYHLAREALEAPVIESLMRRLMISDRMPAVETKVKAILQSRLKQQGPNESLELSKRLKKVQETVRNWEHAIDQGVDIDRAVLRLKTLDEQKKRLQADLGQARMRERLDVDIVTATKEVVAQIQRLPEVLAHGSVAEVKSVLRGFIATIEYNPETRKARVGFYPLERTEPARAILGFNAPESARISMVAGARYEPATFGL
jgi:hypothetical protein